MRKTILLVATIPFQEFTVIVRIRMSRNRREGKKKRRQKRTPSAEYFLIASEGKETEKNYFTHLKNKIVEEKTLSNNKIDLPIFQIEGIGMVGETLINEAEKYF